jgi:tyrosine-protein phosphatase YwqE
MKRMMPAAMGSAHRINKRTSHITLVLAEKVLKEIKNEKEKTVKRIKKVVDKLDKKIIAPKPKKVSKKIKAEKAK